MSPATTTFPWTETHERLAALANQCVLRPSADGRSFTICEAEGDAQASFHPPLLQPILGRNLESYLQACETPGHHALLLLRAGASALGLWQDDELLRHKVIRKYVVRGRGRAQPLHLKTRGKSRYGSRLRLQQAKQQLIETNEKLIEFFAQPEQPRFIFYSVPTRSFPELFQVAPPPPFEATDPRLIKIPVHVHQPTLGELERTHRILGRGRIVAAGLRPSAEP